MAARQGLTAGVHGPETNARAGRPRRTGHAVVGDPTDEILRAAAALFGELGVSATTMSRLAAEVGLGQSSLYYYFRNRDEVVAALVARANVVSLDLVTRIAGGPGSAGAKLAHFVQGDVEALCGLPFDINEVHRIAARDRIRFADYWRERGRLERRLTAVVRDGVESGELRPVDPRLTALTIMANDEGVQNWYRLGSRRAPAEIGKALAELTVGGLVAPGAVGGLP
jgi:TetR/AcrR family transcriptional regulator